MWGLSGNEYSSAGARAILASLKRNMVVAELDVDDEADEDGLVYDELQSHYRRPRVRFVIRTRIMCQAGRARAVGARSEVAAWLCERAPLWVAVRVCALLMYSRHHRHKKISYLYSRTCSLCHRCVLH